MNEYYRNPVDVIREKVTDSKLVAKHRFRIVEHKDEKTGTESIAATMLYQLTIEFKQGRYRYEVTNISKKGQSYYGVENWLEENNKAYHHKYAYYLKQTDDELQKIIADLKKGMGTQPEKEEEW